MTKLRVHELAREFGVTSRIILATLSDMGEYVRSASSTVEGPVVQRLIDQHGDKLRSLGKGKAKPSKQEWQRPRVERHQAGRDALRTELASRLAAAHTYPFMADVERKRREQQRGKRFRGDIDVATRDSLDG